MEQPGQGEVCFTMGRLDWSGTRIQIVREKKKEKDSAPVSKKAGIIGWSLVATTLLFHSSRISQLKWPVSPLNGQHSTVQRRLHHHQIFRKVTVQNQSLFFNNVLFSESKIRPECYRIWFEWPVWSLPPSQNRKCEKTCPTTDISIACLHQLGPFAWWYSRQRPELGFMPSK